MYIPCLLYRIMICLPALISTTEPYAQLPTLPGGPHPHVTLRQRGKVKHTETERYDTKIKMSWHDVLRCYLRFARKSLPAFRQNTTQGRGSDRWIPSLELLAAAAQHFNRRITHTHTHSVLLGESCWARERVLCTRLKHHLSIKNKFHPSGVWWRKRLEGHAREAWLRDFLLDFFFFSSALVPSGSFWGFALVATILLVVQFFPMDAVSSWMVLPMLPPYQSHRTRTHVNSPIMYTPV